jgi:hypothetical protein
MSEKYRKQPKLSYRSLIFSDVIPAPDSYIKKLFNKFFNLRSIGSILCGIFAIHYEKIFSYINSKLGNWIGKFKLLRKNVEIKKKD